MRRIMQRGTSQQLASPQPRQERPRAEHLDSEKRPTYLLGRTGGVNEREGRMPRRSREVKTMLARRTLLKSAAGAASALAIPFVRSARATQGVTPKGKLVLAWHTNIAT